MTQLYRVRDLADPLIAVIADDPVRPHIAVSQRLTDTAEILLLRDHTVTTAVTCMQWLSTIPHSESDLLAGDVNHTVAVFYTIWSYQPGAASELLRTSVAWLLQSQPDLTDIVTLSPPTEMARRFHLKNGAEMYRYNGDTVNYRYHTSAQRVK